MLLMVISRPSHWQYIKYNCNIVKYNYCLYYYRLRINHRLKLWCFRVLMSISSLEHWTNCDFIKYQAMICLRLFYSLLLHLLLIMSVFMCHLTCDLIKMLSWKVPQYTYLVTDLALSINRVLFIQNGTIYN